MPQSIPCGVYQVEHAKLDGSTFTDVGLGDAVFDNVFLDGAKFNNVALAKAQFRDVNLSDATIDKVDLSRVRITHCNVEGMTIDGVPVAPGPRIATYPAFTVIGPKYHGQNKHGEIPAMWHTFAPMMDKIPGRIGHAAYGVCGHFDKATGEFDYIAGMQVKPGTEPPEGMSTWDVPEQIYAIFPTTLANLHQTMDHIYREWLPASQQWRAGDGPCVELYDHDFCHGSGTMYVHVAVAKK